MSDNLKDKTALIIDGGTFLPLAFRLAEDFGSVLFHYPGHRPYPTISERIIGDGFDQFEIVTDLWKTIQDGVDVVVFPDIGHSDLHQYLREKGIRVWGSGNGDSLEINRLLLKELQKELGLNVPSFKVVEGLTKLRKYLAEHEDVFVKISRYRGDMETFHSVDGDSSKIWLDTMAVKWGPLQDSITFIVEDYIDSVVETGYDGFCIDGMYPYTAMQGIECKNRGYIGTVTPYDKFPKELIDINETIHEFLAGAHYRNFLSTEVRITEDKTPYLNDITCRLASPAGECFFTLCENISEIIFEGASGQFVEPKFNAKFAVQTLIEHPGDKDKWRVLKVPTEAMSCTKIFSCCFIDGMIAIPPLPWNDSTIGSIIGVGDTIEDAIDDLKDNSSMLDGNNLTIHIESLVEGLQAIKDEENSGIPFTDETVPKPESAMKDKHE